MNRNSKKKARNKNRYGNNDMNGNRNSKKKARNKNRQGNNDRNRNRNSKGTHITMGKEIF